MTLPPINKLIELLIAEINDPISNIIIPATNVHLRPNAILILPYEGTRHAMGNMKPDVNQPIFSNALNLFPTVVKIVETMV